jgi:hypothetical protein
MNYVKAIFPAVFNSSEHLIHTIQHELSKHYSYLNIFINYKDNRMLTLDILQYQH